MVAAIGQVTALIGEAKALTTTGESRYLQIGDTVADGETVTTGAFGGIEIALADGSELAVGHSMALPLDSAALMIDTAVALPLEETDLNFEFAEQAPGLTIDTEAVQALDISDVLADSDINPDNLQDYLKATYDPLHDSTHIEIYAEGNALDADAVAAESLYVNGDASQLHVLLDSGQLIIDQG